MKENRFLVFIMPDVNAVGNIPNCQAAPLWEKVCVLLNSVTSATCKTFLLIILCRCAPALCRSCALLMTCLVSLLPYFLGFEAYRGIKNDLRQPCFRLIDDVYVYGKESCFFHCCFSKEGWFQYNSSSRISHQRHIFEPAVITDGAVY